MSLIKLSAICFLSSLAGGVIVFSVSEWRANRTREQSEDLAALPRVWWH